MGTRYCFGFNTTSGIKKASYGQYDGYPDGVGWQMIEYIQSHTDDEMNELADQIQMVEEEHYPRAEQRKQCIEAGYLTEETRNPNNGLETNWYWTLRANQGNLENLSLKAPYMTDGGFEFLNDSLFCEYGYIINLEDQTLDYYIGFQRTPSAKGQRPDPSGFYPCWLAKKYPLEEIRKNSVEDIVIDMNRLDQTSRKLNK